MTFLRGRIPPLPDLYRVFSLTIFLVYTWSIVILLWNVPRFILFLSVGEIATSAAYSFSIAFADSLLITALVMILAFIFPPGWMRDQFVPVGGACASGLFGISIAFQSLSANLWIMDDARLLTLGALILVLLGLFARAVSRIRWLASALSSFAQRTAVIAGIYLLLGVLGLITVIFRNVIGQ